MSRKNLAISLPRELYDEYKECSEIMGKTLSELTRDMITALVNGNLRIKNNPEDKQRLERDRILYSVD